VLHVRHEPDATSQSIVGPVQAVLFVAEQTPHAPLVRHAGVGTLQSVSTRQARHARVTGSHTGVLPPHCVSLVQPTHVPLAASQVGVRPPQRPGFAAEQAPHAPDGWHAGAAGPHCASAVHARQACVPASQIGLPPEQSAFVKQPTHTPAVT